MPTAQIRTGVLSPACFNLSSIMVRSDIGFYPIEIDTGKRTRTIRFSASPELLSRPPLNTTLALPNVPIEVKHRWFFFERRCDDETEDETSKGEKSSFAVLGNRLQKVIQNAEAHVKTIVSTQAKFKTPKPHIQAPFTLLGTVLDESRKTHQGPDELLYSAAVLLASDYYQGHFREAAVDRLKKAAITSNHEPDAAAMLWEATWAAHVHTFDRLSARKHKENIDFLTQRDEYADKTVQAWADALSPGETDDGFESYRIMVGIQACFARHRRYDHMQPFLERLSELDPKTEPFNKLRMAWAMLAASDEREDTWDFASNWITEAVNALEKKRTHKKLVNRLGEFLYNPT